VQPLFLLLILHFARQDLLEYADLSGVVRGRPAGIFFWPATQFSMYAHEISGKMFSQVDFS
jgi:hypothetical protein